MTRDLFTSRQVMLDPYYEFYHYYDEIPPEVEFHQHPFYEIFFFLSGDVNYIIEGKIYKLRPGDILLTNNLDIHRPEITPGKPYERMVIWLADTFFENLSICGDDLSSCFLDAAQKDYRLIRPDYSSLIQLRTLCDQISSALQSQQFGSHALASSYLIQFLVQLSRCYYDTPHPIVNAVTENEKINQLIVYLNENITTDLSLDDLADRLYVSKFYLSKQFKRFTGMSIYQYIMKKRLAISRNMLRSGVPVTTACMECGFNDYSNYLKAFKREFGRNPSDYMKSAI